MSVNELNEQACAFKIKYYRLNAGYRRQKDAAKQLGISTTSYVKWENKPFSLNMKNLFKLANLYGCQTSDFFKG